MKIEAGAVDLNFTQVFGTGPLQVLCKRGARRVGAAVRKLQRDMPGRLIVPSRQGASLAGRESKERSLVERFLNKLKHFRGIAPRYDKLAENHLASVKLA